VALAPEVPFNPDVLFDPEVLLVLLFSVGTELLPAVVFDPTLS